MNYKIIGADQKEYGPVTTEQIRQWITQGRSNANTLAQAEGSAEWKPLAAFPEFTFVLGGSTPPKPPFVDRIDGEKLAREIAARGYTLDTSIYLSRAWVLVKNDFWPLVGVSALLLLIIGVANAIYAGIIVAGPLLGGLYRYYLKKIRGEYAELNDAFSGFSIAFLPLFLGYLVSTVLTGVGLLCLILPGIYLAIAWQFTLPLIIDKKMDFWPAMELSRKVISQRWWSFFGFAIVMLLVNILGALALCVGLFVTVPVSMIALIHAYEDIFRNAEVGAASPQ